MNYILSVEKKLGPLSFCRVWHDNSGAGKTRSWFLDQIEVTDLQTGERWLIHLYCWNHLLQTSHTDGLFDLIFHLKQVSEHDQEIPQSELQRNPWHSKEEPNNNHETLERQTKQSNQLSLPHQDDCKTRIDIK